jgi:tetratricopeptide (TPR) repeat protein
MKRANQRVYGFAHTSREIIQQVDHLVAGTPIPPDLSCYLADPVGGRKGDVDGSADIFIVEISTAKEHRFGNWVLQTNYLDRSFAQNGLSPLLDIFRKKGDAAKIDDRKRLLEGHPQFANASPLEQKILTEGYVHRTTADELRQHLIDIERRLPAPVLFVCHVDLPDMNGRVLSGRPELCANMRRLCDDLKFTLLDPTPHVLAYGRAKALEDSGRDINHYTIEFKRHYGIFIFDSFISQSRPDYYSRAGVVSNSEALRCLMDRPAEMARGETAPRQASEEFHTMSETLATAWQEFRRGRSDLAEGLARSICGSEPGALALLGEIARKRGATAEAEAHLTQALSAAPDDVIVQHAYLRLMTSMNRIEDALILATRLGSVSADSRILIDVAKALSKGRRFQEAAAVRMRCADTDPNDAAALADAATYFNKGRMHDDALSAAERALLIAPDHPAAIVQKAMAMERLGRINELVPIAATLAAAEPDLAIRCATALLASGQPEEAAAVVSALVRGSSGNEPFEGMLSEIARILARRGKDAATDGDKHRAARAWRALLLVDPSSKAASLGLRKIIEPYIAEGRAQKEKGNLSASSQAYRDGLSLVPDNANALRELGSVHEKAEEWSEAADVWKRAVDVAGDPEEALLRAARAARKADRYADALAMLQRLPPEGRAKQERTLEHLVRKLVPLMRSSFASGDIDSAVASAKAILGVVPEQEVAQKILRRVTAILVQQLRDGDTEVLRSAAATRILRIDGHHREALKVLAPVDADAKRKLQEQRKRGVTTVAA